MKNTALLIMDYQIDILKIVEAKAETLLKNTKKVLAAARAEKIPVIYVKVAFRDGYPEVSTRNKSFGMISKSNRMLLKNPGTEIHPDVAPHPEDTIVIKHRVGAFSETDLQTLLRAKDITHLIMIGISTSGVILSTLRVAADLDYVITVVSDACADTDEEQHSVLMGKIFPRQADILNTDAVLNLLK